MSDPFIGGGLSDPTSGDASGVYTTGSGTYTSSIDTGVTGLYVKWAYDNGCAAAAGVGGLPVMILMHGYSGDANNMTAADLQRWAARGFVCASVGMRGRNSALGSQDDSAREIQDILDGLAHVRTSVTYASATKASITGYSGGGGNALACRVRSDAFTVVTGFFPLSSYSRWYSFYASAPALLVVDIGGTPAALPKAYAARDIYTALVLTQALLAASSPDGWTHTKHDTGDTIISVADTQRLNALSPSNWTYAETTGASTHRALHGDPQDHPADLYPLEWDFAVSAHSRPALVLPTSGSMIVLGSYVSSTRNFEVWLDADDSTGSPKTNGTGGRNRTALLAYDVTAQTMRITPLQGAQRCYVRIGSSSVTAYLSPNKTTIYDAAAGTVFSIDSDLASAVTTWTPSAPATWSPSAGSYPAAPTSWFTSDPRTRTQIVP